MVECQLLIHSRYRWTYSTPIYELVFVGVTSIAKRRYEIFFFLGTTVIRKKKERVEVIGRSF